MSFFSDGMPLFCKCQESSGLHDTLAMATYGSAGSGLFTSMPLFAESTSGASQVQESMSLWATAVPDGPITESMTLFAGGLPLSMGESLHLFAFNSGQAEILTMYASGQGWTAGATPFADGFPLFIRRNENEVMPLFCCVASPEVADMPLYANGINEAFESMDLVIPSSVGYGLESVDIYAGGI